MDAAGRRDRASGQVRTMPARCRRPAQGAGAPAAWRRPPPERRGRRRSQRRWAGCARRGAAMAASMRRLTAAAGACRIGPRPVDGGRADAGGRRSAAAGGRPVRGARLVRPAGLMAPLGRPRPVAAAPMPDGRGARQPGAGSAAARGGWGCGGMPGHGRRGGARLGAVRAAAGGRPRPDRQGRGRGRCASRACHRQAARPRGRA